MTCNYRQTDLSPVYYRWEGHCSKLSGWYHCKSRRRVSAMVLTSCDGLRGGGASRGEGRNQALRIRPLPGLLQPWHSRASHTTVWNYFYPPRPFRSWGLNPGPWTCQVCVLPWVSSSHILTSAVVKNTVVEKYFKMCYICLFCETSV